MSATCDKTGSGYAESECADAGRVRPLPCTVMSPPCNSECRFVYRIAEKKPRRLLGNMPMGTIKVPPRHSSRGGTFIVCSRGLPCGQRTVSRAGWCLAQIHVGLKVEFVLARPVAQAGMVAELLKRNILRHGIGAFETYFDLTHAIV